MTALFKSIVNFFLKRQSVVLPTDNYQASRIDRYSIFGLQDLVCINVINQHTEDFHTHPWDYISIMLWGGYQESRIIDGKAVSSACKPFSVIYRRHDEFHQVKPFKAFAVTLFIKVKHASNSTKWMQDGVEYHEASFWLRRGFKKEDLRNMYNKTKSWVGIYD